MPNNHRFPNSYGSNSSTAGCLWLVVFVLLIIGGLALLAFKFIFTPQWRAKHWGGTASIELPANQHLVNVTWKDDHLWLLTEPAAPGSLPKTYEFHESSNLGILQGTVIIHETTIEKSK